MRALHQTRDGEPKILTDPLSALLTEIDSLDPEWIRPLLDHPFAPQWRAGFAVRNRYTEDCLAECAARGARQYLILGAGLDTFAYRQPRWAEAMRIFEVDHPATQSDKRARLAKAGIAVPPNLVFVPVDFEVASLEAALRQAGFMLSAKTFCSWLGVTQYLSAEAIKSTLRLVLALPRKSEIVLSFVLPQEALTGLEADAMAVAAERSAAVGEPWLSRFAPAQLAAFLRGLGFSDVVRFSPDQALERYLKDRSDGLSGRQGEQMLRAVV